MGNSKRAGSRDAELRNSRPLIPALRGSRWQGEKGVGDSPLASHQVSTAHVTRRFMHVVLRETVPWVLFFCPFKEHVNRNTVFFSPILFDSYSSPRPQASPPSCFISLLSVITSVYAVYLLVDFVDSTSPLPRTSAL